MYLTYRLNVSVREKNSFFQNFMKILEMVKQFIPKIDISEVLMRNILLDFEENNTLNDSDDHGDDATVDCDDATVDGDDATVDCDDMTIDGDDMTIDGDDATIESDGTTIERDDAS